jgi:hypothetical protein
MLKHRENQAAIVIQAAWKCFKTVLWFKMINKLRHQAASKIQSNFRLIRFLKMGPKIRREKRRVAVTMVQKYIRGYLSNKHTSKDLCDTKIA